jgi:Stage II sporulation protein E (SpoIIE)
MRHTGMSVVLLLLLSLAAESRGQDTPQIPKKDDSQLQVILGDGTAELSGMWKFHTGDDIAWAQPDFDDSGWRSIDVTPPAGSENAALGTSGFIPGWTDNGYPGYSGYAWYRLRINVASSHGALAIKMPMDVDDAYQLFVNGKQIGEFGKFTKGRVTAYLAQPRAFRLPRELRSGPMTIAVRMWMDSATPFNSPDSGGMHEPPVLGHASVINTQIRMDWDDTMHGVGSGFLEMLILLLAWLVAMSLLWMDRKEPAYLWLSLVCVVTIFSNGVTLIVTYHTWISQMPFVLLADVISLPLRIGLWVIFWGYWFRIVRMDWVHRIVWGLALLLMIGTAMLRPPLYGEIVPVGARIYLFPILQTLKLALAALLFAITARGIRKQKTEGWLAFAAVLLVAVSLYQRELRAFLHVKTTFDVAGFAIQLGSISTIVSLFLITFMLVRRYLQTQRKRDQWKAEIEQAQQIQHVLIPDELPRIAGFAIESEYRPAREVGGDFFQIMPGQELGSALIVVGDVMGKGLQAGMLVAVIVGAIRTAAQYHSDPLILMNTLNDQLSGRVGAIATCLILRITADGDVTLANAGHLAPYLNGVEMQMEGALPMGMLPHADFTVMHFQLAPGDTLMLMSDGVAEAQDQHKNLFGFERIGEMLQRPISAAALASAAQAFGQEDDILVLRIQRKVRSDSLRNAGAILAAT